LGVTVHAGELFDRYTAEKRYMSDSSTTLDDVEAGDIEAIGMERMGDPVLNGGPEYGVMLHRRRSILSTEETIYYVGEKEVDRVGAFRGKERYVADFRRITTFLSNSDFFVLPNMLDSSASDQPSTLFYVKTTTGEKWVCDPNAPDSQHPTVWHLGKLVDGILQSSTLKRVSSIQLLNQLKSPPPGVVIDHYPAESQDYIGNPSLAILPDGDYLASHDAFGPGHRLLKTYLFRSADRGASWEPVEVDFKGQYESSLFIHQGAVYILGGCVVGPDRFVGIRRSEDGGRTWSFPVDSTTGRLVTGATFNAGATPTLIHKGRIWRAMEKTDPEMAGGDSREYRAFVMSAPVDADLLDAKNWTVSNDLLLNDFMPGLGWLEGNVVATPEGKVQLMLRAAYRSESAAIIQVSEDGSTLSFNPEKGFIDFPGGTSKFSIRYDAVSQRYWSVVNDRREEGIVRNKLVLSSSPDLVNWTVGRVLLEHPDGEKVGFQYPEWLIDGDDLVFVSRTAWGNAHNFHDANYETFHRVVGFRKSIRPGGER